MILSASPCGNADADAQLKVTAQLQKSASDLWVFGYGSLIWRPGFEHIDTVPATLTGFHRAFCVYSVHHRGTSENPGLVLGLDRSGCCQGVVFRVTANHARNVIDYLRAREQVTGVYRELWRNVRLDDGSGRCIRALCYAVEQAHPQYAGALPLATEARIIRSARGESGDNFSYLASTVDGLARLGIQDRRLMRLRSLAGRATRVGSGGAPPGPSAAHHRLPTFNGEEKSRFLFRRNLHRA